MAQLPPPTIAADGLPARDTGPWVLDKKHYFERYLDIFTRGVGNKWAGKLAYVDLFCGPGRSMIRGIREEVDGSPLLSLKYAFRKHVFVDLPEVIATLRKRLKGHPKLSRISFIEGDCNLVVSDVLKALPVDHLTVAFIDPTGLQIHFKTIQHLVHNRKVDLLMTIQFEMGIRMNLRQYLQSEGNALTAFLGSSDWREDANEIGALSQIARRILDRYMGQLMRLGYNTVRDREIPVRSDQSNLLLYFMVLASRHPRGEDFWRKTTQVGPSGQRLLNLRAED